MCSEATRRRIGFGSTLVCVFFGLALAASGRAEDVVADETQGSTAARATEAGREETEVEDTPRVTAAAGEVVRVRTDASRAQQMAMARVGARCIEGGSSLSVHTRACRRPMTTT